MATKPKPHNQNPGYQTQKLQDSQTPLLTKTLFFFGTKTPTHPNNPTDTFQPHSSPEVYAKFPPHFPTFPLTSSQPKHIMELYASGFNAWNQLSFSSTSGLPLEPDDIPTFTLVLQDPETIEVVHAGFSGTVGRLQFLLSRWHLER